MGRPKGYSSKKDEVITAFKKLYKLDLAFDYAMVSQEMRIAMLEDPDFNMEIAHHRASLYLTQIKQLDKVISDAENDDDKGSAQSILKSIEMKQRIINEDLDGGDDDENALNVFFIPLSREEYEKMATVEIFTPKHEAEKAFDD